VAGLDQLGPQSLAEDGPVVADGADQQRRRDRRQNQGDQVDTLLLAGEVREAGG
jgi:hypothetical protein